MEGIRNTADDHETFSAFGDALRTLRSRRHLSLADLAHQTHYSKGHLNNVERGVKPPTHELAQTCDDVLGSGDTLRSLVPHRRRSGQHTAVRPAQLPATSRRFVGRDKHLLQLDELLSDPSGTSVGAIHGPPGVGKTELALRWAHNQSNKFPDGELFVDLRGHASSGSPADPADTLEMFLLALGWSPDRMPATGDERAALFRTIMHDRRMVIVLDNASSSTQVRPLLPASLGNVVLVTSRSRLEGLAVRDGASEVALQPFELDEALALLREVIGNRRVDALPEKAVEVVRRCGYLPLAVRLAAERVAAHPSFTMEILAADLAEERARLDTLSAGDDEDTAVRAVFSWSYRNLPSATARMFRFLGLHTGPDIDIPAAAALGDLTVEQARTRLENLANGHLIEQPQHGRFRLHNLMHLYASERCVLEENHHTRRQAVRRELSYYLTMAEAAGRALVPTSRLVPAPRHGNVPPPTFEGYRLALAWCDEELPNLVQGIQRAADERMHDLAWQLPAALFEFFHVRKPWSTWEKTYGIGLTAAYSSHSQYGEACMHQGLGLVAISRQRLAEGGEHFQEALAIRQRIGDRPGQAWSLTALGHVLTEQGELDEATDVLEKAHALQHEVCDQQGEAVALIYLANLWRARQAIDQAMECSRRALSIARTIGDRHCEGFALHQLSDACLATDRMRAALNYLHQAVEVRQAAGDRKGEADTLFLLAETLIRAGRSSDAEPHLHDALELFEDRGDPMAAQVRATLQQLRTSSGTH
jgi:tetratricopeptide (TPR) repeat protein/transcriptional regulator with XRE-family HTH domain